MSEDELTIVVCPLGDDCVGDGPMCFLVADLIAALQDPTEQ